VKTKAIIFDIDGTAINSPKQKLPTNRLIDAIDRLKNHYYLSAATGRVWSFSKLVLKGMHLIDPCIISAGTQICIPTTGKILWQKNISEKSLQEVIKIFKQYPKYKLLYNDGTEDDYFYGGFYPNNFFAKEPVYFLEQVFVPNKTALEIYEKIKGINNITCVMVVAQKSGCRDLHVINSSATKEHTINKLLKRIGVKKKNTIGIGDGYNDIHLFNAVGYKVAVGNAVPELKKISDTIVDSVENDGMAKYLESLMIK